MAGRPPLVLCIGNDWEARRHSARLEHHGYDVIAVSSEREGSAVLSDQPVDAVILSTSGLAISGDSAVRRLKKIKPHVPVLLLVPAFTKIPSGGFASADSVIFKTDATAELLSALDDLLAVKFPFFTRWFGNWKHRAGA